MKKTGLNKVNRICNQITQLTEKDFQEVKDFADEQCNYLHPLKHKKQGVVNATGKNNIEILELLKRLQGQIKYAEIINPTLNDPRKEK